MLSVRIASRQDQTTILHFIEEHWKARHVFTQWEELFLWQHADEAALNFVVAEWNDQLVGLLGFIPHRRYDSTLPQSVIATAIWKASRSAPPGVGVRMLNFLAEAKSPDLAIAIGLTEQAVQIKRALGYSVGRMSHYFLPNPSAPHMISEGMPVRSPQFKVGRLVPTNPPPLCPPSQPPKTEAYLLNRYGKHPSYQYDFLRGTDSRHTFTLIVRRITVNGFSIGRIVDFAGNRSRLRLAMPSLWELMDRCRLEYVDFVQFGFPDNVLRECGFLDRDDYPECILPGHFEPFEPRNVYLKYAFKSFHQVSPEICLVRGDSDQDRPNQLPQALEV